MQNQDWTSGKPKVANQNKEHTWTFEEQDGLPPFMQDKSHSFYRLRDVLQSGDMLNMHRDSSFGPSASFAGAAHHQHQHGRRMQVKSRKAECEELVDTAKDMTVYDVIAHFYADDIDEDNGEIDDKQGLIRFDDKDILAKHKNITTLSKTAQENSFSDGTCDSLLSEFHRFIENDSTAESRWIQGSVNSIRRSPLKF